MSERGKDPWVCEVIPGNLVVSPTSVFATNTDVSKNTFSIMPSVPHAPADPILGLTTSFKADGDPDKINVGVGAYRDETGQPWVLPSIRSAEEELYNSHPLHEFAPIAGLDDFRRLAAELAYGKDCDALNSDRVAILQSLSCTGALRLIAGYLARFPPKASDSATPDVPTDPPLSPKDLPIVAVSDPTWSNHHQIFGHAGFPVHKYRYWCPRTLNLDFEGMISDLSALPRGSIVVLHACAHNPTGVDPSPDQWAEIERVLRDRGLFPIADMAYQGFATGDLDKDASVVRRLVKSGPVAVCQSFAKNCGLYGERVGLASLVCEDTERRDAAMSQLEVVARAMYSSPPIYGARLVQLVLGKARLRSMWEDDLRTMSSRMTEMRGLLVDALKEAGSDRDWSHINKQVGMFCYTGMSKDECVAMTEKHHVYMTDNGRISMTGVNRGNVDALAKAIVDVTTKKQY